MIDKHDIALHVIRTYGSNKFNISELEAARDILADVAEMMGTEDVEAKHDELLRHMGDTMKFHGEKTTLRALALINCAQRLFPSLACGYFEIPLPFDRDGLQMVGEDVLTTLQAYAAAQISNENNPLANKYGKNGIPDGIRAFYMAETSKEN